MPTPSPNVPDPHSPRSFPFSTCPDPDETQTLSPPSPSQTRLQMAPSPESPPPSWYAHPPPAYTDDARARPDASMNRDAATPRSATLSPGSQLVGGSTRDVDMDQEPEGMGMMARDDADESPKRSDVDDDVLTMGAESAHVGERGGGATLGGSREVVNPATRMILDTLKQRSDRQRREVDAWGSVAKGPRWVEDSGLVGLGLEYSHMRVIPTPPLAYLRPGSRFAGMQQSERQRYDVEVEFKYVDMRESFLCGYLRIQGLTDSHPTLTTYFEGEVIGTKYGFITQHPSWGATEKIDISHWSKFTAFKPYLKHARKGGQVVIKDVAQRENIFMRWKEQFLVPDHRVRTITGASFEGFYYICFNQVRGEVSGIYFHSNSVKFQQLELKHVDNKGCFGAIEFR